MERSVTEKKLLQKVLVANRGEIAIRISRAVQEEGKKSVVVYETPDKESRHIHQADEAIWIGAGPRKDYLDIDKIIWAARKSGCGAVHPGYGFLAENPELPKACEMAGLVFIGPPSSVVMQLGDKTICRRIAKEAGIPVVPGSNILPEGPGGVGEAKRFGRQYGYPLMLKAVAGGGGRGIRKVENEAELASQLPLARSEAKNAFDDDRLYLEKGLVRPRHVEVQILADHFGNIVHLGARNCSIQRRHQKLVEVAPGLLPSGLEDEICKTAIAFARKAGYRNAGTVEFLVDSDGRYYFLEINTRLQVEHTVTEAISGIDIVRQQLRIAQGFPLAIGQESLRFGGVAIELRINAEDPKQNFAPEAGKTITVYSSPGGPGIRLDGCVYQGYTIPAAYDSLLAKLTVFGYTWPEAVSRLERALKSYVIMGPKTTIPFYQRLITDPDFLACRFDTEYLDRRQDLFDYKEKKREEAKIAALLAEIHHQKKNPFAF